MSYRISTIDFEQDAEAMVAADSFDTIVARVQRMVTAGRGMVVAVREFTYLDRSPVLHSGLHLDTAAHKGGFLASDQDDCVALNVRLTNGGYGYHDTLWFGFSVRTFQHSGNETEAQAWKRYESAPNGGSDRLARRSDMTHIAFTGGLPGYRYQHTDRIVITDWNGDGVATEMVLGFEPGDGSW